MSEIMHLVFFALDIDYALSIPGVSAVECGVSEITTFESERCIVRAKGENESKKVERRQRIALEAAKQSGRGIVPLVNPTVSFSEMCRRAAEADIALFCAFFSKIKPFRGRKRGMQVQNLRQFRYVGCVFQVPRAGSLFYKFPLLRQVKSPPRCR